MRFNDRFSIAGAAGVLGLVIVVGLFGLLSVLGADPSRPLNRLGSEGEEVVAREGSDGQPRSATAGQGESESRPATAEESRAANESPGQIAPQPTRTPAVAVLAAIAPGEGRPTPAPGQPQATPVQTPTAVPTAPATPQATPNPTAAPTELPTPTPQPDVCSSGGTPVIRENGKHVRLEYATVLSLEGDVLLVEVGGTVTVLRLTALTVVTGNLSAATLVRAEGHREVDGSVTADLVEVLCPDSARG